MGGLFDGPMWQRSWQWHRSSRSGHECQNRGKLKAECFKGFRPGHLAHQSLDGQICKPAMQVHVSVRQIAIARASLWTTTPALSQKRSHYRSQDMDLLLHTTLLRASSQGDGTRGFNVQLCYGDAALKVDGFPKVQIPVFEGIKIVY